MSPVDEWIRSEFQDIKFDHIALLPRFLERYLADDPVGPPADFVFSMLIRAELAMVELCEEVLDSDDLDTYRRLTACTLLAQLLLSHASDDDDLIARVCSLLTSPLRDVYEALGAMPLVKIATNNLWRHAGVRASCQIAVREAARILQVPAPKKAKLSKRECLSLCDKVRQESTRINREYEERYR